MKIKSFTTIFVYFSSVPSAPTGVIAERTSATQISVLWSLQDKAPEPVLYYTVQYFPLNHHLQSRRAVEHIHQMINTTKNITINGLYPTFIYNVSVAANTAAGTGKFSKDITVGCKYIYSQLGYLHLLSGLTIPLCIFMLVCFHCSL